jgi:tetratricopeptide (TPR) repeat protein
LDQGNDREGLTMSQMTIDQAMRIALQNHQAGRLAEAERIYRQVLAQVPDHWDALHFLGVLAAQLGHNQAAVDLISRSLQLKPDCAEAYSNLANAQTQLGKLEEAVVACHSALKIKPDCHEAYSNLGHALTQQGKFEEAVAACRKAIELKAAYPEAYNNMGNALADLGRLDEAIVACRRAIELKPDFAEAYLNLGAILRESEKLDEAIDACRNALRLNPAAAEAYSNLGASLIGQGKIEEAHASYLEAIRLKPDYAEAHWNLANALLLKGEMRQGWAEYEWRWKWKSFPSRPRNFSQQQWQGEELHGRSILIHAEQGLGDTLQFIRFLPEVAARGGKVILECQPELLRLLKDCAGAAQVISTQQSLPAFDIQCPLLSIPLALGIGLESIPHAVPYLTADSQLLDAWAARIHSVPRQLNVGLTWAGSPRHKNDRNRSIPLKSLAPLATAKGARFYSLQKGPAARDAIESGSELDVMDCSEKLGDFADTAALIANLDLVITVDTAVAHLAGAMGKPVWVMLPFLPDWRWMLNRDDSPWYPTMRLFRQPTIGQWGDVIQQVAERLLKITGWKPVIQESSQNERLSQIEVVNGARRPSESV